MGGGIDFRLLWGGRGGEREGVDADVYVGLVVGDCWAAPHSPASLVVAQTQDRRKSPETATETSMVYCTGGLTQRVLERHPTVCSRRWAGHSGEQEATVYWGLTDVRWAHQLPKTN